MFKEIASQNSVMFTGVALFGMPNETQVRVARSVWLLDSHSVSRVSTADTILRRKRLRALRVLRRRAEARES